MFVFVLTKKLTCISLAVMNAKKSVMSQGRPGIWNLPILYSQIEKKKKNALLFEYQNLFSTNVLTGDTAINFYVSYWRWDNHFLGHLSHAKV